MRLEQTLNFPENAYIFNWSLSSGMNIVKLGCRCGTLWFFNRPSAEILISSLKFDQFDPFSQMTQKVCQKSAISDEKTQKFWVNSEILSRVGLCYKQLGLGLEMGMFIVHFGHSDTIKV